MFIAVLFTIIKLWKQPKYPNRGVDKKDVMPVYRMEYYSDIKEMNFLNLQQGRMT